MIRVMLVDDQELVRTGFRMVLGAQPDIEVVGEAADGLAAVEALRAVEADVVLMDVRMPRMDGVEAARVICAAPDGPKVLILTTFDLDEYAFAAIKAGAAGFLLKDVPLGRADQRDPVGPLRRRGGRAEHDPPSARPLRRAPAGGDARREDSGVLTAREREVMVHVARGLSNSEIAARLHLAEATVKTHLGRILAKLGLRDRAQVVVYAYETGVVSPDHPRG